MRRIPAGRKNAGRSSKRGLNEDGSWKIGVRSSKSGLNEEGSWKIGVRSSKRGLNEDGMLENRGSVLKKGPK